jgi:hypothetical protein
MTIPYSMAIVAESDAAAHNTLQTECSVPVIVDKLSDLLNHCQSCKLPTIDGYYGRIEQEPDSSAARQAKLHCDIIASLQDKAALKTLVSELNEPIQSNTLSDITKTLQQAKWKFDIRRIHTSSHYSDQVDVSFRLIVGLSEQYFPEETYEWKELAPPPKKPTGFGQSINAEFNNTKHTLTHIGSLFRILPSKERQRNKAAIENIFQLNDDTLTSPEEGFQVFHQEYPAPIPSTQGAGIFGTLFGVAFPNPKYLPKNSEPATCIRAISLTEYVDAFGYDPNISNKMAQQDSATTTLRRTVRANTTSAITRATHHKL